MRYISNLNISFSLLVNGVDKRFCFTPCTRGGSMYIAKNDDEIKALEASDMYGRIYRRMEGQSEIKSNVSKKAGRKSKSSSKVQDVKGVETWQEAIEYLVNNHGSDRDALTTPDEILAEASKIIENSQRDVNISFVNELPRPMSRPATGSTAMGSMNERPTR